MASIWSCMLMTNKHIFIALISFLSLSPKYPTAPSPNIHRILGTFFVPLSSLVFCSADSSQFTYFELWSMPSNLCRTTVLSWDYRSLNCNRELTNVPIQSLVNSGAYIVSLFFQGLQFYAVCILMSENSFLIYFVQFYHLW